MPIVESAIKIIEEEPEDTEANTSGELKETTSLPPNLAPAGSLSNVLKDPLNVNQGPQSLTNFKLQQPKTRKKSTESNQSSSQKSDEAASTIAVSGQENTTDQSKEVTEEELEEDDGKSHLEQ